MRCARDSLMMCEFYGIFFEKVALFWEWHSLNEISIDQNGIQNFDSEVSCPSAAVHTNSI